jgi:hypothetical protein
MSLKFPLFIICWIALLVAMGFSFVAQASTSKTTSVQFTLTNSYTWSWSVAPNGLTVTSGGIVWVHNPSVILHLTSSIVAEYGILGDVIPSTITGTIAYSQDVAVTLLPTSGTAVIRGWLIHNWEPLMLPDLVLRIDQTAPTMPFLTWIADWSMIQSWFSVPLGRTSVDTGVGIAWYQVYVWLVPDMSYMISFLTTGSYFDLPLSLLPYGTMYWTVVAIDHLWNRSAYMVWYFHNHYQTSIDQVISPWGSRWWEQSSSVSSLGSPPSLTTPTNSLWNQYSTDFKDGWKESQPVGKPNKQSQVWVPQTWIPSPVYYWDSWLDTPVVVGFDCGVWSMRRLRDGTCREWDHHMLNQLETLSQWSPRVLKSSSTNWIIQSNNTIQSKQLAQSQQSDKKFHNAADMIVGRFLDKPVSGWALPKWQRSALWIQYCEQYNYCFDPDTYTKLDARQYESIIHQYGQSYVSRTVLFSWYVVFMTTCLILTSMWFFIFWYHHHYIIKYLKH